MLELTANMYRPKLHVTPSGLIDFGVVHTNYDKKIKLLLENESPAAAKWKIVEVESAKLTEKNVKDKKKIGESPASSIILDLQRGSPKRKGPESVASTTSLSRIKPKGKLRADAENEKEEVMFTFSETMGEVTGDTIRE